MHKQTKPVYEYVDYDDYSELRQLFESQALPAVRNMARKRGITFQHHLIGSGHRHMVTRIKGGNGGFDLDYNLELQRCPDDPKKTKLILMECFDAALVPLGFEHSEDSTAVITVKKVVDGRIEHSFDIALTFVDDDDVYYIHHDKGSERYLWSPRGGDYHLEDKIEVIEKVYSMSVYDVVRDSYLHLKNVNADSQKRSFSLVAEANNNEFNNLLQTGRIVIQDEYDPYYDDDDDD